MNMRAGPTDAEAPGELSAPNTGGLAEPAPDEFDRQAETSLAVIEGVRARYSPEDPDEGYFPAGSSTLHMLHWTRAVGLSYGQRALVIGGTDAENYIGTSLHTRPKDKERPFNRLVRTAGSNGFEGIFFGTRAKADTIVDRTARKHSQVRGDFSRDAGPHPAGTPYSAFNPARMLWTMACMADSAVTYYETLERPLSGEEREDFWQDYRLFGELFGLSREESPPTYPEFREYFEGRIESGELHLTDAAKYMGHVVGFEIPVTGIMKLGMPLGNSILLGTLPQPTRELYGLEYGRRQELAFQSAVKIVRAVNARLPERIKEGPSMPFFKAVVEAEARQAAQDEAAQMPENAYQ